MLPRMAMLLGHVTKESHQSPGPGTIFFHTEDLRKNMNQNTKKTDKEMLQSHEALLQEGSREKVRATLTKSQADRATGWSGV